MNGITSFALSRPGKAGGGFELQTPFWGQMGLWANCFMRHVKKVPVSWSFPLKAVKGL